MTGLASETKAGAVRDFVLGLLYIGLALAVVVGSLAVYNRVLSDDITVTLDADNVGNAIRKGSDVKYQGVPVGRVTVIEPASSGARLTLSIDNTAADTIPGDVLAQMLPASLFGERYVALVSTGDLGTPLADGDQIVQDGSDEAQQISDLFDSLLPVLTAVQPEKLNATLSELAQALDGRGDDIGTALVQWGDYLEELNPHVPALTRDLALLGDVAQTYDDAAPDFLLALQDVATTTETFTEERGQLDTLFATVTTAADTTTGWLSRNSNTIIRVARDGRKVLSVLGRYSPEFPCLAHSLVDLIPQMDDALGAGTARPGIRAVVKVVPHRDAYRGGPTVRGGGPVSCPGANGGTVSARAVTNSPTESRVLNEMVGLRDGSDPEDLPDWSALVIGPAVRGTEVTLR